MGDATLAREDGVARYARLASVMRQRIANGEWLPGQRLPTVAELARQHRVAAITARQAYALLAREGLVHGTRGRGTFVADVAQGRGTVLADALRAAINDPRSEDLRIELIEQKRRLPLPESLCAGFRTCEAYDLVRKRHLLEGEPFCLVEIHVDSELRALFPRGAEKRQKIAALINRHAGNRMREVRQTLRITVADDTLAQALDCPFATPVVCMVRHLLDHDGRIALAGRFWYRGDRFVMDTQIPFSVWLRSPETVIPEREQRE